MTTVWNSERIHARLATVREADPDLKQFGAARHRYQLGPPLSEADVTDFEARHGVTLPEDYRSFLIEVGDGEAGPHYGLFRLDDVQRYLELDERCKPRFLATPFPHTDAWNPWDSCQPESKIDVDDYDDEHWVTGSLVIAEIGCGAFHRLVANGPVRGQVWSDHRAAAGGLTPEAGFRDWYGDWLDRLNP